MTSRRTSSRSPEPDPTIRDEALAALAKREEAAAERRAELLREREEREAKEHAARVRECRPILTEVLGHGWSPVDSGDRSDWCWVTFEPSDESVDLTLIVTSTGTIAVAEKSWGRGGEPNYGPRIESLADLGRVIKDQQDKAERREEVEA